MPTFDLFSKRQKRSRGEVNDVFTYHELPPALRVQIVHIIDDALGDADDYNKPRVGRVYQQLVEILCREYGVFSLIGKRGYNHTFRAELVEFILNQHDVERVLDAVELAFRAIDKFTRNFDYLYRQNNLTIADEAINELNIRMREHAVGYQFEGGEIIRVDSQLLHSEVVKPALQFLQAEEYAGAQEEFLSAHEHYRHGNTKEALADSLKALESIMKAICNKRKWAFPPNATANPLIEVCIKNGLIPEFWAKHFSGIRSTLEGGVPTVRNKLGGHGQGTEIVEVPMHIVSYVLHMTASTIVFLVEAEKALG